MRIRCSEVARRSEAQAAPPVSSLEAADQLNEVNADSFDRTNDNSCHQLVLPAVSAEIGSQPLQSLLSSFSSPDCLECGCPLLLHDCEQECAQMGLIGATAGQPDLFRSLS